MHWVYKGDSIVGEQRKLIECSALKLYLEDGWKTGSQEHCIYHPIEGEKLVNCKEAATLLAQDWFDSPSAMEKAQKETVPCETGIDEPKKRKAAKKQ